MQFFYRPEGTDESTEKVWDFDPKKLMNPEAEAIERHTGMTYVEWKVAVTRGSMLALHGLLFVLLKRADPTLKWLDVEFCEDEVGFKVDDKEEAEILEQLEARAAAGEQLDTDEERLLANLRKSVDPHKANASSDGEDADVEGLVVESDDEAPKDVLVS